MKGKPLCPIIEKNKNIFDVKVCFVVDLKYP
jgi:hypothetical protein